MAVATAQKVKLYKATYEFLKSYNGRDSTLKISLLNAIRRGGKKDYFGIPLIGYAWVIFKNSPHFATSHGFNLLDTLRNQQFDKFADILDDLFTSFWESKRDWESFEQQINKTDSGDSEHPEFVSEQEHEELGRIEGISEIPRQQEVFEGFVQERMQQFHTPQTPTFHLGGEHLVTSSTHLPGELEVGGGEKAVVPEEFKLPLTSPLPPLKSLKVPQSISLPIKKFIRVNITPMRITSLFTGGIGAIVGYGATNTPLGAMGGGIIGTMLPTLVKTRGAGQWVLTGVTKAGNAGANFLSGISSGGAGGGGFRGGGLISKAVSGGKKWALLALLGFIFLSAFLVGFTPTPSTPGGGSIATGSGTITGTNNLGYSIPFRDTTVRVKNPDDIKNRVRNAWPNAQLQNWDTIVNQSIANGWNPAFVLTLWIEESGAQGVARYDDAIGCEPTNPTTDINISLRCLFNSFPITRYPNEKFADFMCMYSESKLSPCQFITNPNFPKGIKDWYSRLVPDGSGALQIIPTATPPSTVASSYIVSCPLSQDGTGSFRFICGTFNNPRGGGPCGHGNPLYYVACTQPPYAECPFSAQLKAAVDVRPMTGNGANAIVYLPYINGNQSVKWTKVKGPEPISGGKDGYKVEYEADFAGKRIRIDLTHINGTINSAAQNSGDVVSTLKAGVDRDGGGHLHTAVSVDGKWVDAISEVKLCTP